MKEVKNSTKPEIRTVGRTLGDLGSKVKRECVLEKVCDRTQATMEARLREGLGCRTWRRASVFSLSSAAPSRISSTSPAGTPPVAKPSLHGSSNALPRTSFQGRDGSCVPCVLARFGAVRAFRFGADRWRNCLATSITNSLAHASLETS